MNIIRDIDAISCPPVHSPTPTWESDSLAMEPFTYLKRHEKETPLLPGKLISLLRYLIMLSIAGAGPKLSLDPLPCCWLSIYHGINNFSNIFLPLIHSNISHCPSWNFPSPETFQILPSYEFCKLLQWPAMQDVLSSTTVVWVLWGKPVVFWLNLSPLPQEGILI